MQNLPASIQHFFPPFKDGLGRLTPPWESAQVAGQAVIARLGGLRVGSTGPGVEQAQSDIEFHEGLRLSREVVVQPWRARLGDLVSVADAHHGHIMLFVDAAGRYYAFTDPDSKLYALGEFHHAMEKLLLGFDFGSPLEPAR